MKKINILLVGFLGKTGLKYTELLLQHNHNVYIYDKKKTYHIPDHLKHKANLYQVTQSEFDDLSILNKIDKVTLSPGVPLSQPIFTIAKEKNIPIFSELDYCYPFLKHLKWVIVTGTDGKSTTVSLIHHILNTITPYNNILCGNIGTPFSEVVLNKELYHNKSILIAELSSYQLELISHLQAQVAILLNVAHDHLDRYENFNHYKKVKLSIQNYVSPRGLFLLTNSLAKELNADYDNFVSIDTDILSSQNFCWKLNQENAYYSLYFKNVFLLDSSGISLLGHHQLINILFVLETILFLDSQFLTNNFLSKVKLALSSFQPLPHRFEKISTQNTSHIFVNDSKATTTNAVSHALESAMKNTIILLGGKGKKENYELLFTKIKQKNVIPLFFGAEGKYMYEYYQQISLNSLGYYTSFKEACNVLFKFLDKQNTIYMVLLSPACTSWDEFSSFEERGNTFKNLVLQYIN